MTITDAMVEKALKAYTDTMLAPPHLPGGRQLAMRAALEAAYPQGPDVAELEAERDRYRPAFERIAVLERENEALRKEIDSREAFWAELKRRLPELERENEALRKEIDSREAFWAELKRRLPELERENEALQKHVAKLQRELAFAIDSDRQAHDYN